MLTSYLKDLFNHKAEISSLISRMDATKDIADRGEKVLEMGSIADDASRMLRQAKAPSRWAEAGFGLGIAMEAAAFFAGGWALMLGGLAVAYASNYVRRNIGATARNNLDTLKFISQTMETECSRHLTAQDVENSPSRDKLLARYPALRGSFGDAANGNTAPAASAPSKAINAAAPKI